MASLQTFSETRINPTIAVWNQNFRQLYILIKDEDLQNWSVTCLLCILQAGLYV